MQGIQGLVSPNMPGTVRTVIRQVGRNYDLINLQYPLSIGLNGGPAAPAGPTTQQENEPQLIAIMDGGFPVRDHQEFIDQDGNNKINFTFAEPCTRNPIPLWMSGACNGDHGLKVAAVAAGLRDGKGITGVAPGANIHYTTGFFGDSPELNEHINNSIRDAAQKGAVVQNNSWGYDNMYYRTLLHEYLNQGISVLDGLAMMHRRFVSGKPALAGSKEAWQNYVDALTEFTKTGVVVFANTNSNVFLPDVFAGLPLVFPELRGKWIVANNIARIVEDLNNPDQLGWDLISGTCEEAAEYCLSADGYVFTATEGNANSYGHTQGTSFAAPQVSGGVAIMAQAFPNLRPEEWVSRLLASADNSFFPDAPQDTFYTNFGNGVRHAYREDFGHGVMDLRAALLPIGNLGVATSARSAGPTVSLSRLSLSPGLVHGKVVQRALQGHNLALFDDLGTDFYLPATALTPERGKKPHEFSRRLDKFGAGAKNRATQPTAAFGFSSSGVSLPSGMALTFGWAEDVGSNFGVGSAIPHLHNTPSSLLGLAENSQAIGAGWQRMDGYFGIYAFGNPSRAGESSISGLGMSRAFHSDNGAVFNLGVSGITESESFLGLRLANGGGFGSTSGAINLGFSMPVGETEFFVSSEFGGGRSNGAGLIHSIDPVMFGSFAVGSKIRQIWNNQDALTVAFSQPMRIESGTANIRLPVGRTKSGNVVYSDLPVDLKPEARQLDLGFDYALSPSGSTDMRLGGVLSFNEGHEAGQTGGTVMGKVTYRF